MKIEFSRHLSRNPQI